MSGEAAGFWRRVGASVIDGLVVGIVEVILRLLLGGAGIALSVVFSFGYYTYFHGRTGQTPGDAALGIRVVDIDTGNVIGYGRAFGRCLVSIVSGIVIGIGYLWMLWDRHRQTWHDKAVSSLPVRV
ncbi:MAG TPA: RDD family protein [Gaiellaceae bacterium]|nr:RDD family protein [Gaiellaceae bacterium]